MSRGADPDDRKAFASSRLEALRVAVSELSWLLGRGYAELAALTLVGDKHQLTGRQRHAVRRCACTDTQQRVRQGSRRLTVDAQHVGIDTFNVLIGVERALGGGALLRGRDGALRDVGGVHGTWRRAQQTDQAITLLDTRLAPAGRVTWLLDQPVSNSGRLAARLRDHAEAHALAWTVEVVVSPDRVLKGWEGLVATADGVILDAAPAWIDLVDGLVPEAWVVDLGSPPESG